MDTQWEYKTISMNTTLNLDKDLNQLGEENWEVVAAGGTTSTSDKLILKRPKRQQTRKRDDDYGYGR